MSSILRTPSLTRLKNGKVLRLLLLILAAAALAISASSLDGLRLQPGLPFPTGGADPLTGRPVAGEAGLGEVLFSWSGLQVALALAFAGFSLYLVYSLVRFAGMKRLGWLALILTALLALLVLLPSLAVGGEPRPVTPATSVWQLEATPELPLTVLEEPPAGFSAWVIAGLALLLAAGGGWFYYRSRPAPASALARPAQAALAAIRSGEELGGVIIRCYEEMSAALREQAQVERSEAMTAREFESLLALYGAPAEPVRELTRLFELARYSRARLGEAEEQAALASLTAITRSYTEKRA